MAAAVAQLGAVSGNFATSAAVAEPRVTTTANYRVHSELPADLTGELARELELCFVDYSRRLGDFGPGQPVAAQLGDVPAHDGRYDVHLFATRAAYETFTDGTLPNSAGAFYSARRSLCACLEGQARGELKQTLRHEAFHQFAYERLGAGLPVWVNEGLAQLFEYGVRVGDELVMGQVPAGPLKEVQAAAASGTLLDFAEVLSMGDAEWAKRMADQKRAGLMYAQTWAMVHFLVYASDPTTANGQPLYRQRFVTFLRDVASGQPGESAWRASFGTNVEGFRARFVSYLATLRPTGVADMLDRQEVLARMLILLRDQGETFASVDAFRTFARSHGVVLHRSRNGVSWSTEADPAVYFADAKGKVLDDRRLRFVAEPGSDLPTLVRRPGDGIVYRTRFYREAGSLQHETTCSRE